MVDVQGRCIVNTPATIAADIAANPYAWPGGYERWAITDDGGQLCHRCCKSEARSIAKSVPGDGWHVVVTIAACEVDDWSHCNHCSTPLPGMAADNGGAS